MANDWNLEMVRARQARALLAAQHGGAIDWGNIVVGHIDTGVTQNPVFDPWQPGQPAFLRIADGRNVMEPQNPPLDPMDYGGNAGHGTRTSSVLCGHTNDDLIGVAPGLPVIPYRAVNDVILEQREERRRVAHAIEDAVAKGCAAISISLGFPQLSLFHRRDLGIAVDRAYLAGVIVCGAGGQFIDRVTYPGKFWRSIGVGGVNDDRTVYQRYEAGMAAEWIDIWGPADPVFHANGKLENGAVVPADPTTGDGTSYATAHVAAAAAMWLAFHGPAVDALYGAERWRRVEAFRTLIAETSDPVAGNYWPNPARGILNIEKLLQAPLPQPADLLFESRLAKNQIF